MSLFFSPWLVVLVTWLSRQGGRCHSLLLMDGSSDTRLTSPSSLFDDEHDAETSLSGNEKFRVGAEGALRFFRPKAFS